MNRSSVPCFGIFLFWSITIVGSINLEPYEQNLHGSAAGEDGITKKLLDIIGPTNKYYVEFGVGDATQCNTRFLRKCGYQGLMMDKEYKDTNINLQQEYVTAENIIDLLTKYNVPQTFDVLSIDIDFNDFYVLHNLLTKFHPRIIIAEYNSTHLATEDRVVIYDQNSTWDGSNYFGASLYAFYNLGIKFGYTLVYAEKTGVNLFLVRDTDLKQEKIEINDAGDCNKIYRPPTYGTGPNGGHPVDRLKRPWACSKNLLEQLNKPLFR